MSPDGKRLAAGYRGPGRAWGPDLGPRRAARRAHRRTRDWSWSSGSPSARRVGGSPVPARRGSPCSTRSSSSAGSSCAATSRPGSRSAADDQVLAIPAEKLGSLRLWDVAVNREIAVLDCPRANGAVTFSPDGRYLIASNGDGGAPLDPLGDGGEAHAPRAPRRHPRHRPQPRWDPAGVGGQGPDGPDLGCRVGAADQDLVRFPRPGAGRGVQTRTSVAWSRPSSRATSGSGTSRPGRPSPLQDPGLGRPLWTIEFTPDGRSFWAQGSPQAAVWRVRDGGTGESGGIDAGIRPLPAEYLRRLPESRRAAARLLDYGAARSLRCARKPAGLLAYLTPTRAAPATWRSARTGIDSSASIDGMRSRSGTPSWAGRPRPSAAIRLGPPTPRSR